MTEWEKMAQIIAEHLCPQGKAHERLYGAARMCYSRNNFADCDKVSDCVDALIEAGYGDVKEAERRAEIAERALLLACTNLVKDEKDNMDIELLARVVYTKFLRKAEKELTEEKEAQERRLKEIKGGKCK